MDFAADWVSMRTKETFISILGINQNVRQEIKVWLEEAQEDMKTAQINMQNGRHYAAVQFAQQTAEKSFKAIYLFKNLKQFPFTHDLIALCRDTAPPKSVQEAARKLSPVHSLAHYPTATTQPSKLYNKQDAIMFIKQARIILKWVQTNLKS